MSYEFLLVHPYNGERAVVQVKTGRAKLNIQDHADKDEQVFLFQANGLYDGTPADNVVCLERAALEQFIADASSWLPRWLTSKASMARGGLANIP